MIQSMTRSQANVENDDINNESPRSAINGVIRYKWCVVKN